MYLWVLSHGLCMASTQYRVDELIYPTNIYEALILRQALFKQQGIQP